MTPTDVIDARNGGPPVRRAYVKSPSRRRFPGRETQKQSLRLDAFPVSKPRSEVWGEE